MLRPAPRENSGVPTVFDHIQLASGLSAPDRLKDLADVQELIRVLELTEDVGDRLHPEVRPEYHRLWSALNPRCRCAAAS